MAAFNDTNLRALLVHLQDDEVFFEGQIKTMDAQLNGMAVMLDAMRERLEEVRGLVVEIDGLLRGVRHGTG